MQDFFAALVAFFLLEPLQQQVTETLAATRAPQEVVTALASCASDHGSEIIDRALCDPWWATSTRSAFGAALLIRRRCFWKRRPAVRRRSRRRGRSSVPNRMRAAE